MKNILYISIVLIFILPYCKSSDSKYNVDVSNINIEIKTKHFEKDLFKFNVDSAEFYINYYKQNYGEFFKLFNYQIIEMGSSDNDNYGKNLDLFVRYWKTKGVYDVLQKEFPDFDTQEMTSIKDAFKHYKYYFPEYNLPEVYTYFSSFGYSVVTLDSVIGIGLDKYLGEQNFHLYDKVGFSMYQKRRMIKEMIPVDIIRSMIESDYPINKEVSSKLLNNMVYEGKIQYCLNCLLPNTADTLKWRYTTKQLSWAKKHESKVWNYIAERKILFSTDKNEIRKFVGDGPYTSIFTDVSAPRVGAFIGFRIVEDFMNKNNKITLKELMLEKDARKILSAAKYNP